MPRQYTPRVEFKCPACSNVLSLPPSVATKLRVCSEACRAAMHPEISVTGRRRGVYAIIHRDSGRAYIGSSVDVRARLLQHLKQLQQGTSPHPGIRAAWREFGGAAFYFEMVEEVETPVSLFGREQFWMDLFRKQSGVFNSHPRADTPLGTKRTPEAIRAIALAKAGSRNTRAKFSEADVPMILDRLNNGESMSAIARSYGVSTTPIYRMKRGEWGIPRQRGQTRGPSRDLPLETVEAIRADAKTISNPRLIAERHGINRSTVCRILKGQTHHATAPEA